MFRNIGTTEIILIALIVLVLFGGRKLPELSRGITDAIREFKKASGEDKTKKEDK